MTDLVRVDAPPTATMRTRLRVPETFRWEYGGVHTLGRSYTEDMNGEAGVEEISVPETQVITGEVCEMCGTEMFGLHCKLVCPNCGYRRDCSDP